MFHLSMLVAWGKEKVFFSKLLQKIKNTLFKEMGKYRILKDCWFLFNCFCGETHFFFSLHPFFWSLLLWKDSGWSSGSQKIAPVLWQQWSLSQALAPWVNPVAWHWGGWEWSRWHKDPNSPLVSGKLRAFSEIITSGQGIGSPAPSARRPLTSDTQVEGLQREMVYEPETKRSALNRSWEPGSWQILWKSAIVIINNMHHKLWRQNQRKMWSWFYPFPQSFLNFNFSICFIFSYFVVLPRLYFLLAATKYGVMPLCTGRKMSCSPELPVIQWCGNWFMWPYVICIALWDPFGRKTL